ncbi:ARK family serine/threonine protein kinase [Trichoderma virens Gv29-8]|uniref:non-specific serine/threonine protein kinase n=1 Tax=Hypocrea virens (strain Gv29-8 / FGSC 10586) TaxID=413071 RepID=G9N834_HYPVG|nr:ARK family serine/threonine protein kinase [Trichoderma virens Gv29-8]EHK17145.1 ARK family serine/threonine protein kinase [Trichoderma virens Gv29-8]
MAPQAHHPHAGYPASGVPPANVPPAGTFAPGTKIQVGNHRVQIQKYLSEGGFAHVYLVKLPKAVDGTDLAVLKRVAVPDKEALRGMRTEVETMKRLKGHQAIVTYIDSHASELKGGGYEVFLLMEFCDGGGLIDFMNTRLQHRLTEPEIINIFADIAEGVACMHYLKPPLLHRDLKVENVLITNRASGKRFKLCDFGSAAPPRPAPMTVVDCRLMDEDVQKHTTLQYRSPEMVDVYRKQPINEKSDIWALGVLLYKLCYYTTPFEDQGQLAILNASYRYPSYPVFSDRLKKLIASMLKENMQSRPNIYQVLKEACAMQGREMPIHDIYSGRASADPRLSQHASATDPKSQQAPVVGAVFSSAPVNEQQALPDITPMRRGRPTPSPSRTPVPGKVTDGDPFAALDSKAAAAAAVRRAEPDELSSRFPRLDEFSLLLDQKTFNFDSTPASPRPQKDLSTKVAERLADEAFASSRSPGPSTPAPRPHSVAPISSRPPPDISALSLENKPLPKLVASSTAQSGVSRAQSIITSNPELKAIANKTATSSYVSTGTMTEKSPDKERAVDVERSRRSLDVETPRAPVARAAALTGQNTAKRHSGGNWPSANTRSSSVQPRLSQSTVASSRTSLDILSSQEDLIDMRSSAGDLVGKPRPLSSTFEPSTLEYLRERENASKPSSRQSSTNRHSSWHLPLSKEPTSRSSRSIEVQEYDQDRQGQRPEAPASTSKNLLAGKFGGAFKRFENNASSDNEPEVRSSSPSKDQGRRALTPIQGSEAADDRSDSDGEGHSHMTAEMRRDMERRQLEEEEARVEAAQAEYRRRVAEGAGSPSKTRPATAPKPMGAARAASIQNRVQSLLSEEQKPANVPRTAHGYGRFTDAEPAPGEADKPRPEVKRKPIVAAKPIVVDPRRSDGSLVDGKQAAGSASASASLPAKSQAKPTAPKKPVHLNNIPTGGRHASSPTKERDEPTFERLIAIDLPGQPMLEMTSRDREDYIEDFSKRFPSLSTIELSREGGRERDASR